MPGSSAEPDDHGQPWSPDGDCYRAPNWHRPGGFGLLCLIGVFSHEVARGALTYDFSQLAPLPEAAVLCLRVAICAVVAVVATGLAYILLSNTRCVRWGDDGVEVTDHLGRTTAYPWAALASITVPNEGRWARLASDSSNWRWRAVIRTLTGPGFAIDTRGGGYGRLVAALLEHGVARTERAWWV